MKNYNKISNLILRYGLAATYLYSGYSLIFESRQWLAYVPYWFAELLPIDIILYLKFQGVAELLLAAAFITGYFLRPAAFISALEMVGILALFGFDGVTFRDLAILGGSLAVFFQTYAPAEGQVAVAASAPDRATTNPGPAKNLSDSQKRFRIILVMSAFILFSVILVGLFWLSNTTKDQAGWYAFSYATGLSMIVLPCTLPLAFVIVPLAMGKDPKKGVAIALAFSLGITITLSIYGAIIAKLGQVVGLDQAKNIMYTLAGVFAVVFGLGELGLIKLRVPAYSGAFPKFIQDRKDVSKGFLLGLLLGNVGLGCPNPAFYVLLSHIATVGSMSTGWLLTFIHAVGRVTPLMLLAILAALGVDALTALVKKREILTRVTAWGVVGVGAFIFTFGVLGHDWYVYSGIHSVLEVVTQEMAFMTQYAEQFGGIGHAHGVPAGKWLWLGNWIMALLIIIPLVWTWRRKYKDVPKEDVEKRRLLKWNGAYVVAFSLFLITLLTFALPTWFIYKVSPAVHHDMGSMTTDDHAHDAGATDDHAHDSSMPMDHSMMDQAAANVEVRMNTTPAQPLLNRPVTLEFIVIDKATNQPTTDLDLSHEAIMHVVGVRNQDLGQFFHIHPQVSGDRFVVNYTFTQAGTYSIWPGIVYKGAHVANKMPEINIGNTASLSGFVPVYNRIQELNDDLVVSMKAAQTLNAGTLHNIGFSITDSGGFDVPLGKYLAENMHINIVSQDTTHYHHLHTNYGMIGEDGHGSTHDHSQAPQPGNVLGVNLVATALAQGDGHTDHAHGTETSTAPVDEEAALKFNDKDMRIRFAFPEPGQYKIFAEFVAADAPNRVQRAEYWVTVGDPLPAASSKPINKILLAIISVILIAAVMPLIFRYLNEDKIKV